MVLESSCAEKDFFLGIDSVLLQAQG
jgi:hypothetical protein